MPVVIEVLEVLVLGAIPGDGGLEALLGREFTEFIDPADLADRPLRKAELLAGEVLLMRDVTAFQAAEAESDIERVLC